MHSENRADPYHYSLLSKQQHSGRPLELQERARASTQQLYTIFSQFMGH